MTLAADTRGLKRVCSECGGRFYDLNKRPIVCPFCQSAFTGEMKLKRRRSRTEELEEVKKAPQKKNAMPEADEDEDEDEDDLEDAQEISLEDPEDNDDLDEGEDDLEADLNDLDEDDLDADLDEDLGNVDAGIDLDESEDDLDADLEDVKKNAGGEA